MNRIQEGPEVHRKTELRETHEVLFSNTEKLTSRADRLNVIVHGIIECNGEQKFLRSDASVFGASLGKLPLAHMVIDHLYPGDVYEIEDKYVVQYGGGDYDLIRKSHQATTEVLLEDMLMRSGNTPFRLFADVLGGVDVINEYYRRQGWVNTRVNPHSDGLARLGNTTPSEVLDQFKRLMDAPDDNPLIGAAQEALFESTVFKTGIRQNILPTGRLIIANKTGEHNGDDDKPFPVPYIVRHDVGRVEGPEGIVTYVIMTKSPRTVSKLQSWTANKIVGQFGAEFARAAGGPALAEMGRMARRAAW